VEQTWRLRLWRAGELPRRDAAYLVHIVSSFETGRDAVTCVWWRDADIAVTASAVLVGGAARTAASPRTRGWLGLPRHSRPAFRGDALHICSAALRQRRSVWRYASAASKHLFCLASLCTWRATAPSC